jgi:hypothetical protein
VSLTTYSGLKSAIADWLNRTDLATQIPTFIELAENRIAHEIRIPTMEKTILLDLNDEGYATIPSDFLEVKDIFYNYDPMTRVSLSEIHRYENREGPAEVFARETYRLRFYPIPSMGAGDEMRMIYYHDVGRLSDEDPTNAILSTAPELYLFGSLSEAADYLGSDPAMKQSWEDRYQMAVSRITMHARQAELGGSTAIVANGY